MVVAMGAARHHGAEPFRVGVRLVRIDLQGCKIVQKSSEAPQVWTGFTFDGRYSGFDQRAMSFMIIDHRFTARALHFGTLPATF